MDVANAGMLPFQTEQSLKKANKKHTERCGVESSAQRVAILFHRNGEHKAVS